MNRIDKWRGVFVLGCIADACGHSKGRDVAEYSDDTVLTLSLANAILACNGKGLSWDAVNVMKLTQEAVIQDEKRQGLVPFKENRRGYGVKTWKLLQSWSPESAHERGTWDSCGLVMKISSLAALEPSLSDVSIAGFYTHGGNTTAVFVAWLHVQCLRHLFADRLLTWDQVFIWANANTDPFLHAALSAAKSLLFQENISPFQKIFNGNGRSKSVVVYICALWFALPYLNAGKHCGHFEGMLSNLMMCDSLHDADTIAKLAAELMGARFGWNSLSKRIQADPALNRFVTKMERSEDMTRLETTAVAIAAM